MSATSMVMQTLLSDFRADPSDTSSVTARALRRESSRVPFVCVAGVPSLTSFIRRSGVVFGGGVNQCTQTVRGRLLPLRRGPLFMCRLKGFLLLPKTRTNPHFTLKVFSLERLQIFEGRFV